MAGRHVRVGRGRAPDRPLVTAARPPFPRVVFRTHDRAGSLIWRVIWPCKALTQQGYFAEHYPILSQRGAERAVGTDAVVLTRLSWLSPDLHVAEEAVASQHAQGRPVFMEMDDDLVSVDCRPQLHLLGALQGMTPRQVDAQILGRLESLHRLDGCTVTTPALAAVVRGLTDTPVVAIPNAIDWDWWQEVLAEAPARDPRLTIGWAGGKRLPADTAELAVAWARVARRYPHVAFKLAGYEAPDLAAAVPADQRILAPWLPIDRYPEAYAGIDIGCCPLADTPFNRCKTAVKAFEYAALGAAVVASPTVYGPVLGDGRLGLLATTADDWEAALCTLVEDRHQRFVLAARWAKRVRERHSLPGQAQAWVRGWSDLIQQARARHGLRPGRALVAAGMYHG
jgi:glycosyltransferase involved in cell wall biosynthesis